MNLSALWPCRYRRLLAVFDLRHQPLPVEDSRLAIPVVGSQDCTQLCGRSCIGDRTGDDVNLQAKSVLALPDNQDRTQLAELLAMRLAHAFPKGTQTRHRVRAAEVEPEL